MVAMNETSIPVRSSFALECEYSKFWKCSEFIQMFNPIELIWHFYAFEHIIIHNSLLDSIHVPNGKIKLLTILIKSIFRCQRINGKQIWNKKDLVDTRPTNNEQKSKSIQQANNWLCLEYDAPGIRVYYIILNENVSWAVIKPSSQYKLRDLMAKFSCFWLHS